MLEGGLYPGGEGTEGSNTECAVGGVGIDGRDATNDMTYIALGAYGDVPDRTAQFRRQDISRLPRIRQAAEYDRDGVLMHLFNDRGHHRLPGKGRSFH